MRAERLYYDLTSQRAILLDATLSTVDTVRNIPLYMRAKQIRQLSRGEFAAKKATFSSSEFYTPHYSIGAGDIFLQDLTSPDETSPDLQTYAFQRPGRHHSHPGHPGFLLALSRRRHQQKRTPPPPPAGQQFHHLRPLHRNRLGYLRPRRPGRTQRHPRPICTSITSANADLPPELTPSGTRKMTAASSRAYIMEDHGNDNLGFDRQNVPVTSDVRGRFTIRHQQDLDDGWSLSLEGSYVSDPTFLEQFFGNEFDTDKEQETSIYLKKQGERDALTFLGKFSLFDFTSIADKVDDQFTTEKRPEVKYWRIGDSFFDTLTYYSETSASNLHTMISDITPAQLGFLPTFIGFPAAAVPSNMTFRQFYKSVGITDSNVLRGDTRQELDLPLHFGDVTFTPYATGRLTAWNDAFPESNSGDTTRMWGQVGFRSSIAFWKTYSDVNSQFWDIHGLRHIIEPQFNAFVTGTTESRSDLQFFDRDVEGISRASGASLSINQKWQTKRGGEGHWRNVDWLVLNVQINQFWHQDNPSVLFPFDPLRGFYFLSRPELSLAESSVAVDSVWRVGERARIIAEANYNTDRSRLEQFATGLIVDQTDNLAYFFGNRYVDALNTDEWTIAVDYHITRKYEIIAAESYDISQQGNILSSVTLIRRFPRFNTALTITYDANNSDTSVVFTAWPEGFPESGFGNRGATTGTGTGTSTGK